MTVVSTKKWRRYPEYRSSGVEWLGEIPEHWKTCRLKYLTSVNDDVLGENTDPDFEMLYVDISSVDSVSGIQKKEPMRFENAPSRARRQVRNGDVIISTVRTYLKAIAPIVEPESNLTVSTGFAVIRPKNGLDNGFAAHALRASYFVDSVVARSVGVSYPAINACDLVDLRITLPPLFDQRSIATFLDRETVRIDGLIEKKERQITLLQEKRTALISHAVTMGLNPNVKMRPSGIEWLGEVPEHWEVKRLKYVSQLYGRIGFRGYTTDDIVDEMEGAISLSPSNMANGKISLDKSTYISWDKYDESPEIQVAVGDLIIVKTGSTLGKTALVEELSHPMTINPQLAIFKHIQCDRRFLFRYVYSPYIQNQVGLSNTGGTIPTMTQETVGNYAIPIPPLPEQQKIASFLDRETERIDGLSKKILKSIEKLREYRTALISAAVTGKIDVR